MSETERKGIVIVRLEDGREVVQTKYIYLRMKKAGRKVKIVKEASTLKELERN